MLLRRTDDAPRKRRWLQVVAVLRSKSLTITRVYRATARRYCRMARVYAIHRSCNPRWVSTASMSFTANCTKSTHQNRPTSATKHCKLNYHHCELVAVRVYDLSSFLSHYASRVASLFLFLASASASASARGFPRARLPVPLFPPPLVLIPHLFSPSLIVVVVLFLPTPPTPARFFV